jgi:hypothetical protein
MAYTWSSKDSCTYLINTKCGAPGFYFSSSNTAKDADILISYLEWDTAIPGFTRSVSYN